MAYSKDKEPVTIFLPKGSRKVLADRARRAQCRSVNEYATAMLMDGKVNHKRK